MDAGNHKSTNGWNMNFLMKKKLFLQASQKQKLLRQSQELSPSSRVKNVKNSIPNTQIEKQEQKKLSRQDIIEKGEILKIIERTLNRNEFKIKCKYEDEVIELIANKEEIIKNSIIPLLDFYEKTLGLR